MYDLLSHSLPEKGKKKYFIDVFMKEAVLIWKNKLCTVLESLEHCPHLFDTRKDPDDVSEQPFESWLIAYAQQLKEKRDEK